MNIEKHLQRLEQEYLCDQQKIPQNFKLDYDKKYTFISSQVGTGKMSVIVKYCLDMKQQGIKVIIPDIRIVLSLQRIGILQEAGLKVYHYLEQKIGEVAFFEDLQEYDVFIIGVYSINKMSSRDCGACSFFKYKQSIEQYYYNNQHKGKIDDRILDLMNQKQATLKIEQEIKLLQQKKDKNQLIQKQIELGQINGISFSFIPRYLNNLNNHKGCKCWLKKCAVIIDELDMILLELKYSMLTSAKKRNQAVEYLFNSDTKKIMFLDSKIEKSHMQAINLYIDRLYESYQFIENTYRKRFNFYRFESVNKQLRLVLMQIELGNKVGIVCNSKKLLTKIYVFIKTIFKDVNILMLHAVDDIFVTKNIRDEFGKSADNYIEKNKIQVVLLNAAILCGQDITSEKFQNVFVFTTQKYHYRQTYQMINRFRKARNIYMYIQKTVQFQPTPIHFKYEESDCSYTNFQVLLHAINIDDETGFLQNKLKLEEDYPRDIIETYKQITLDSVNIFGNTILSIIEEQRNSILNNIEKVKHDIQFDFNLDRQQKELYENLSRQLKQISTRQLRDFLQTLDIKFEVLQEEKLNQMISIDQKVTTEITYVNNNLRQVIERQFPRCYEFQQQEKPRKISGKLIQQLTEIFGKEIIEKLGQPVGQSYVAFRVLPIPIQKMNCRACRKETDKYKSICEECLTKISKNAICKKCLCEIKEGQCKSIQCLIQVRPCQICWLDSVFENMEENDDELPKCKFIKFNSKEYCESHINITKEELLEMQNKLNGNLYDYEFNII